MSLSNALLTLNSARPLPPFSKRINDKHRKDICITLTKFTIYLPEKHE